jgi:hypothetical protein
MQMGERYAWYLFYLVFFCTVSFVLGGDASPDTRAYHLYIGYAAITGGRPQDIAVAGLQSYFCPVLDAWNWRLVSLMDDHPSQLHILLGVPYAVAASLIYRIGNDILPAAWPWRKTMAGTAALFGVTGAASFAVIGTMMSEIVPGLPLLAGVAIWVRNPDSRKLLAASGALAGLSVALKLTELPIAAGFFLATVLINVNRPPKALLAAAAFGAPALISTLAVAGPWWLHNWRAYGDPIFPYFNDVFHSPQVAPLRWSDERFKPHGIFSVLIYPAVWAFQSSDAAIETKMHDPRMLIELVAILTLIGRSLVSRNTRALAAFCLIAFALWELEFSIYRYLAILECLSGVLAAAALISCVPKRHALTVNLLLLIMFSGVALTTKYPWWERAFPSRKVFEVALPAIPGNALVLLLDEAPLSSVVPFLPASVTVVGTNNNLVHPGAAGLLQQTIAQTIRGWTGPIWGLEDDRDPAHISDATLAYYRLRRVQPCATITGNIIAPLTHACLLRPLP